MGFKFKVAYNTLAQIIGKVVSAGVGFLITALVAKKFGLYSYGEFTKIINYIPLFYLLSDFGFNAVFLREEKEKPKDYDFSSLLGLRLVWSLLLTFLAISILPFLPYNSINNQGFSSLVKLGIITGSLTILTQGLYTSLNAIFQKFLRYDFSSLALAFGNLFGLGLIFLITFRKSGVPYSGNSGLLLIMAAFVICYLLIFLTSFYLAKRLIPRLTVKFNFPLFKNIFFLSLPLGITLIFNLIYFRIDSFILTIYRSTEEVGLYGLAYKFFETILVIPTFYLNAVYPEMLARHQQGKEKFKRFIILNSKFLILISIICSLSLFFSSKFLVNLISGPSFKEAIIPLQILSLSLPLFFLSSLFMWVLITFKKQTLLVIFYGLSMILNITLNLIYIPRYGYIAAAITTGVTELFVVLLTGYTSIKYLTTDHFNKQISKTQISK